MIHSNHAKLLIITKINFFLPLTCGWVILGISLLNDIIQIQDLEKYLEESKALAFGSHGLLVHAQTRLVVFNVNTENFIRV